MREGKNLSLKGFSFLHLIFRFNAVHYMVCVFGYFLRDIPYLFPLREKMIQKGLEKEEREKERTFP